MSKLLVSNYTENVRKYNTCMKFPIGGMFFCYGTGELFENKVRFDSRSQTTQNSEEDEKQKNELDVLGRLSTLQLTCP